MPFFKPAVRNLYEVYLYYHTNPSSTKYFDTKFFITNDLFDHIGIKKRYVELQEASAHWIFWNEGKGRLLHTQ
jgi:hypothetical protein